MHKRTRVNHPPQVDVPDDNRPLIAPIYQSVKFSLDDTAQTERLLRSDREGFFYSRVSNPTLRQLELLLAELQGREACLLTGSGVAAVSACLLALCRSGDHVLAFVESYGPTRHLVQRILGRYGVEHTLLSIEDLGAVENALAQRRTKLVIFESPTNPVTKIADIERLTALSRKAGALTVMDNTFAGFHNHGAYDVDIFVHSLTKYASGHGDVMGGAIIASRPLIDSMRHDVVTLGPTLDPHAAFLIQRGMRTYFLRYERQCENALRIAAHLDAHAQVKCVHYPGLSDHPQHQLAKRQMHDFGTIVTFELLDSGADRGVDHGTRFADALEFFSIAASLGSTESLVMPGRLLGGREFTPAQRAQAMVGPGTVRLSIGIEDVGDLIADIDNALRAAAIN